jgi:hypothetical protein
VSYNIHRAMKYKLYGSNTYTLIPIVHVKCVRGYNTPNCTVQLMLLYVRVAI